MRVMAQMAMVMPPHEVFRSFLAPILRGDPDRKAD
jgi:hypothetical protein